MENYVALDLETTGLSPKNDRILEIGKTGTGYHSQQFIMNSSDTSYFRLLSDKNVNNFDQIILLKFFDKNLHDKDLA